MHVHPLTPTHYAYSYPGALKSCTKRGQLLPNTATPKRYQDLFYVYLSIRSPIFHGQSGLRNPRNSSRSQSIPPNALLFKRTLSLSSQLNRHLFPLYYISFFTFILTLLNTKSLMLNEPEYVHMVEISDVVLLHLNINISKPPSSPAQIISQSVQRKVTFYNSHQANIYMCEE